MATKKATTKSKTAIKKAPARKSVAKKAPAKKTAVGTAKKKLAPKKTTRTKATKTKAPKLRAKVLVCADTENCFWTTDGQVLRDLDELQTALSAMANDVFNHHVSKDKNDFADWVEHVLLDEACATALRKSKKSNTARTVVVRHLRLYNV